MKLIKREEIDYNGDTYNLHIENDHNYIVNDCVVSNCHGATATIVSKLLQEMCVNAKLKVGMSGSLHDAKINDIQLTALFGNINKSVTTKDLIDQNYLTPIEIKMIVLKYSEEESKIVSKLDYPTEQKFIMKHPQRFKILLKLFSKINNNSLVLFKNIAYGKLLYEKLKLVYPDRIVYYVAGSTDADTREQIRKLTETHKDAIIVASMQVFSTGINITSLKYLIFAQPYKSRIKIIQSIGRTLRKHNTKEKAIIIDLVDDFSYKSTKNFSLKHAVERLKIYKLEKFNYTTQEIKIC